MSFRLDIFFALRSSLYSIVIIERNKLLDFDSIEYEWYKWKWKNLFRFMNEIVKYIVESIEEYESLRRGNVFLWRFDNNAVDVLWK